MHDPPADRSARCLSTSFVSRDPCGVKSRAHRSRTASNMCSDRRDDDLRMPARGVRRDEEGISGGEQLEYAITHAADKKTSGNHSDSSSCSGQLSQRHCTRSAVGRDCFFVDAAYLGELAFVSRVGDSRPSVASFATRRVSSWKILPFASLLFRPL